MGSAMARALRDAGLDVILYNRTPERAAALAVELGCDVSHVAARGRRQGRHRADDAGRRRRGRCRPGAGPKGLLAGARPGTVLVDLSTVTPDTIRVARGATPGRPAPASSTRRCRAASRLAESGQLTLMVGGTAEDLERARPALEPLAKTIVHVGPLGAGAAMKLAVNTVIFGLNEALAEGLVLAEAAGVDRAMAYDVIAASAVGAPYVGYKRAAFVEPEATPVAFSLDLAAKDLGLIHELADGSGWSCPRRRRTSTRSGRRPERSAATPTSPPSRRTCATSGSEPRRRRQEGAEDRTASQADGPGDTQQREGSESWPNAR